MSRRPEFDNQSPGGLILCPEGLMCMSSFSELASRRPTGIKKTAGIVSGYFAIKKADRNKHLAFKWFYTKWLLCVPE